MTSLNINDADIPDLTGKKAIITGGASGIGLATAQILARHGATVHALDISPSHPEDPKSPSNVIHKLCDVSSWASLVESFKVIGIVDIAVANAGVGEDFDLFASTLNDDISTLEEPNYHVIDVNLRSVLNFIKLSLATFKSQGYGGSIVITSSATAYSPEQRMPVYSAVKLALIGLVRALRPTIPHSHGATINAVAPAATFSRLLPPELAKPIKEAGMPISTADHVGRAIVYAATATQTKQVEGYGRDSESMVNSAGRWNGRVIFTLGETYTEVEEPIAGLRNKWLGQYASEMTTFQQTLTDARPLSSRK